MYLFNQEKSIIYNCVYFLVSELYFMQASELARLFNDYNQVVSFWFLN